MVHNKISRYNAEVQISNSLLAKQIFTFDRCTKNVHVVDVDGRENETIYKPLDGFDNLHFIS